MAELSHTDSVYTRDLTSERDGHDDSFDVRLVIVGSDAAIYNNSKLMSALKVLSLPYEVTDCNGDIISTASVRDYGCIFVLQTFEGNIYDQLHKLAARIMGPSVLIQCANHKQHLPANTRPLYSKLMHNCVVCFTGFKIKDQLIHLVELVHHMGGSIRKDFSARVTHLVANYTSGDKYRAAVSLGTPVMTEEWVKQAWSYRNGGIENADDAKLASTRMSPFSFSILSFYGFSKEDQIEMERLTVSHGGSCVETGAPSCTHLVVEERSIKTIPFETQSKLHLVKSEWFWGSIQMDACADESIYKFDEISDILQDGHNTPRSISASKSRKRKRLLQDNLRELASDGDIDSPFRTPRQGGSGGVPPANKRRSNELARMSFSASFLDATADTSAVIDKDDAKSPMPDMSKMNPRQYTALELLQTETNYVSILSTIINTIQAGIEEHDQPGGPLLPPTDVKLIFGKVPAIYEVHKKIRNELSDKCQHWQEESCIGDVFVKHADELMKAYPPYINFVSQTQETIAQCDKTKPRFHAFLKVCLTKPECGRQSLAELLIRPVQRLPSICLLLKDILRRTDKAHADHKILQHAKETLDDITSYINEDKRITEGHQALFDIINDIDNCPPNLLSSHRTLITKVDCLELSQTLTQSREPMTLFVFSDSIEMVRRRGKLNSKSPATKTPQKTYKHLEMIYCKDIRKIADINPTPDCRNIFALIVRELNKKERLYSFVILDDEICKSEFLTSLSKVISTNTCRADYENLLVNLDASALQIDTTDLSNRTLSKAATKFGRRVSRAFSFNKTPRKLKRAMTSMSQAMSPFNRRDSMSYSTTNLAAGASRSTLTPSTTRCASLRETRSSSITPSDRPTLRLTNNNDLFEESPVSSANCSPTMSTNTMEDVSTIPYFQ